MKRKSLLITIAMSLLLAVGSPLQAFAADNNDDYLHTDGNKILDEDGNQVRLTGIAWFGNETPNYSFHGLWANTLPNLIDIVADSGFNILRIPLSVEMVNQWRQGIDVMPDSINDYLSPELKDKTSLDILDMAIDYCKQKGVKVMFDMHRIASAGQTNLWYTGDYTTEDFEDCWVYLADRYKDDDTVVAADLFNEPHGKAYYAEVNAKWDDSTDDTNWKYEAEKVSKKILDVNPNLLVVVEGIETYPKEGYTYDATGQDAYYGSWWGGNLRGVKDYPVDLGEYSDKVIYSPHDYGPTVSSQSWFEGDFTQESLTEDCWRPNWFYIHEQNIAPVLIGEWGAILDGAKNQEWFEDLANFIKENQLNHTFWCLNPNSGDTEGILGYDFATIDTEKLAIVQPTLWQTEDGKFIGLDHKVNLGANGTHVSSAVDYDPDSSDSEENVDTPDSADGSEDIDTPDEDTSSEDSDITDSSDGEVDNPADVVEEDVLLGDVDGDGKINVKDLLAMKQYIGGVTTDINEKNADVNGDGSIDVLDTILIQQYLKQIITSFPASEQ